MVAGEVIHSLTGSNFTDYYYYSVLIPNGVVAIINGVTLPSMAAPITIPVGISSSSSISGSVFLIGRKKPEFMADLLSTDPGNSTGSYSIR